MHDAFLTLGPPTLGFMKSSTSALLRAQRVISSLFGICSSAKHRSSFAPGPYPAIDLESVISDPAALMYSFQDDIHSVTDRVVLHHVSISGLSNFSTSIIVL